MAKELNLKVALPTKDESKFISEVKGIINAARNTIYRNVNNTMIKAYWEIGRLIIAKQDGSSKSGYGAKLLETLSQSLTQEYGKGYTQANLKNMRQFYTTYPNGYALRSELSWTHYRLLMRVEKTETRTFYEEELKLKLNNEMSMLDIKSPNE